MTKKINRNDLCYCGSGKKYKKCCLNKARVIPAWRTEASKIEVGQHQEKISNTFFVVSDYLKENPIHGACHLFSGIFYILLKEQDVESDLCIGEVQSEFGRFDHSWTQINGEVYDIAIQVQLDYRERNPVYAGVDLGTGKKSESIYGIRDGSGLDAIAGQVSNTPFVEYMDGFPGDAWNITVELMKKLNLKGSIEVLREKHKSVERKLMVAN